MKIHIVHFSLAKFLVVAKCGLLRLLIERSEVQVLHKSSGLLAQLVRAKVKKPKSLKINVQSAKVKIKSSYALKIKMQSVKFF